MPDTPRIKDLRRRAASDPASIVFAALAEEYRRAERFEEAIVTCRAGLEHHPSFLSARVTLGRALIEVGELAEAKDVLEHVVSAAPENLAAIRALAEIHSRQGELDEEKVYSAMAQFVAAEPGLHEAPHRLTTAAPATQPVGVGAAEPVGPPTQSARPGVSSADTAAPATHPVWVPAAEPVGPRTQPARPGVSSADTGALRALDGFLVAILVARAQRERASTVPTSGGHLL